MDDHFDLLRDLIDAASDEDDVYSYIVHAEYCWVQEHGGTGGFWHVDNDNNHHTGLPVPGLLAAVPVEAQYLKVDTSSPAAAQEARRRFQAYSAWNASADDSPSKSLLDSAPLPTVFLKKASRALKFNEIRIMPEELSRPLENDIQMTKYGVFAGSTHVSPHRSPIYPADWHIGARVFLGIRFRLKLKKNKK